MWNDKIDFNIIFVVILIILCLFGCVKWLFEKQAVSKERDQILSKPITPDIQSDIVRALSGDFEGEELSPLTYLGYRAGKTKGLREDDRRKRLEICFSMEMPKDVPVKYRNWGRAVTYSRYASIFYHLLMLANQRRGRPDHKFAISDWETDRHWFEKEFGEMASRLKKYRFRQ